MRHLTADAPVSIWSGGKPSAITRRFRPAPIMTVLERMASRPKACVQPPLTQAVNFTPTSEMHVLNTPMILPVGTSLSIWINRNGCRMPVTSPVCA